MFHDVLKRLNRNEEGGIPYAVQWRREGKSLSAKNDKAHVKVHKHKR
jgi:hypothetical protein